MVLAAEHPVLSAMSLQIKEIGELQAEIRLCSAGCMP